MSLLAYPDAGLLLILFIMRPIVENECSTPAIEIANLFLKIIDFSKNGKDLKFNGVPISIPRFAVLNSKSV